MKNLKPIGKLIDVVIAKNKVFLKNLIFDTIVGKKIKAYTLNKKWCLLTVEKIMDVVCVNNSVHVYVVAISSNGTEYNLMINFDDFIYN